MKPVSEPDQTEVQISSYDQAVNLLTRLPETHPQLTEWRSWAAHQFTNQSWAQSLEQAVTVAYARMALRNGILSSQPRSYHNECHINDLLIRVMKCAKYDNYHIGVEGLALLSFFAATHDLRQAEPPKSEEDDSLVGANEMASYQEAERITALFPSTTLWRPQNLLIIKTMIEGSTFGSGGKRSKNFFQGNLAKHLLSEQKLPHSEDEQLVLLACDIDTANVSLPMAQFAQSGIEIYDELVAHQNSNISAWQFFSEQQKIYFFEQQAFHAEISKTLFLPQKEANAKLLESLCQGIEQLPQTTPPEIIKQTFIENAQALESTS